MDITKLTRIEDAPSFGHMLIYTRAKVELVEYTDLEQVKKSLEKMKDILEIHLFNEEKEYRSLKCQSKRFTGGWIEHVAAHSASDSLYSFIDDTILDTESKEKLNARRIKVVNKVSYSDNGMAIVDDYRLLMEAEK